jgi:putative transposase
MVRSGCEWRMLPVHFPPWQTVYWWFRRFVRLLLFRTIHNVVLMINRAVGPLETAERRCPRQPVGQGAGGGRHARLRRRQKVVGRKRHIAVDADGRLLMVNLTTADISDSAGAQAILQMVPSAGPG